MSDTGDPFESGAVFKVTTNGVLTTVAVLDRRTRGKMGLKSHHFGGTKASVNTS
jgi:hypothetical protein